MKTSIEEIQKTLINSLEKHTPTLKVRAKTDTKFEVAGTIPTMQGKQKVDGIYFSSVIPKPKDVRLYFFPIYTHPEAFKNISEPLRKCLKGKSCFHIKKIDESLESDIHEMIKIGIDTYKKEGLL